MCFRRVLKSRGWGLYLGCGALLRHDLGQVVYTLITRCFISYGQIRYRNRPLCNVKNVTNLIGTDYIILLTHHLDKLYTAKHSTV